MDSFAYPPQADSQFVQACGELNNQDFTLSNIQNLHGTCYVSCGNNCGTVAACQQKDIDNYLHKEDKSLPLSVSQGKLDGNWICRINVIDSKIKAVASYFYD